jgi:hypothetical protein
MLTRRRDIRSATSDAHHFPFTLFLHGHGVYQTILFPWA